MSRRRKATVAAAQEPPRPPSAAPGPARGRRAFALAAAGALLFGLGVLAGAAFLKGNAPDDCARRYEYVNRVFVCGTRPVLDKGSYLDLRTELLARIEADVAAGRVREVAIFLRDLVSGPVLGINDLSKFAPASLLKLPLVLTYMNAEEILPGFIDRKVAYSGDLTAPEQIIPSAVTVGPGEHEIRTLLANTLIYSDNLSYLILSRYLRGLRDGEALAEQTFRELGIITTEGATDDVVNVHGYASLFRQLYNATYLTPDLSELVLSWLARSEFAAGLSAGVPPGTTVAHKFGERVATDPATGESLAQFHDCGIVYYPENPYLLCVMTRGTALDPLIEVVRGISERVYREVDSRRATASRARSWGLQP
jgi:beta-lactamase class A